MNIFDTAGDSPEIATAVRRQVKRHTVIKDGEVFISTTFLCMLMDRAFKSGVEDPIVPVGHAILDLKETRLEIDKSDDVVPVNTVTGLLNTAALQGMFAEQAGNGTFKEADKIAKRVISVNDV